MHKDKLVIFENAFKINISHCIHSKFSQKYYRGLWQWYNYKRCFSTDVKGDPFESGENDPRNSYFLA